MQLKNNYSVALENLLENLKKGQNLETHTAYTSSCGRPTLGL